MQHFSRRKSFSLGEANWSVQFCAVPTAPTVDFQGLISLGALKRILASLHIALDGGLDGIDADDESEGPAQISLRSTEENHAAARQLCDRLATMGVSHTGYFQVGGVWMMQHVQFNDGVSSVVCWPAGMRFTSKDAENLHSRHIIPGKNQVLDRLFEAGGYVAVDLEMLGIKAPIACSVSYGVLPNFVLYGGKHFIKGLTYEQARQKRFASHGPVTNRH